MCFLCKRKKEKISAKAQRHKKLRINMPDVPGEMFAPTENHTTLAVTSALEGLSRGRAITLVDAGAGGRG